MINKYQKMIEKPVPTELSDDALNQVSGGGDTGDLVDCPECGKKMRQGFICSWCDMADGVATCHICGGEVTREKGCSSCGMTWDAYYHDTQWLRGM